MSQATAPADGGGPAASAGGVPGASSPSPPGSTTGGGGTSGAAADRATTITAAAAPAPAPAADADAADGPQRASSFAADAYAGGLANLEAARAAEAHKPYVADKEPFGAALGKEYERGAAAFGRKIAALALKYGALRRTRGDGNCFYRAVAFAHLEWLVQRCGGGGAGGGSSGAADVKRFAEVVRGWKHKLMAAGYQELVFEDALDMLLGLLALIDGSAAGGGGVGGGGGAAEQRLTIEGLVSNFRDDVTSNTLVMLLRMVTSAELMTRREFFEPFLMGLADEAGGGDAAAGGVEAFCRRCVEPMGEESDHVQAVALTDAMQVPVRVVYLDSREENGGGGGSGGGGAGGGGGGSGGGGEEGAAAAVSVPTVDFVPDACGPGAKPVVHVLYRPGHYDICYPLLVAPPRA
jgi:ubiquitin thioesterase protein OTUB1